MVSIIYTRVLLGEGGSAIILIAYSRVVPFVEFLQAVVYGQAEIARLLLEASRNDTMVPQVSPYCVPGSRYSITGNMQYICIYMYTNNLHKYVCMCVYIGL